MPKRAFLAILVVLVLASAGCGSSVGNLRESGDVAGLVAIAKDSNLDYTKRSDAVDALGELGTREAVDALLAMLETPETSAQAARALGSTGDSRAVEPLITYLDSLDPDAEVVLDTATGMDLAAAARALGGIQDPKALAALLAHLDAGHAASISVAALGEGLAGQGRPAVPALKKRLASANPDVWAPASLALGEILSGKPAELSQLLKDKKTFRIYLGVLDTGSAGVADKDIIAALKRFGDRAMANAILASGTEATKDAAKQWGEDHGYVVRELQPWEDAP